MNQVKAFIIGILMIGALLVWGCSAMKNLVAGTPVTPAVAYMEAQKTYLNLWNPYHKAWLALPGTDPRKAQWVREYHPKFYLAGEYLQRYKVTPSTDLKVLIDRVLDECETILLQLAIKKGA